MITADNVANALGKAKKSGDGWMAQCPAHDDQNPSLSIRQEGERLLVSCHAGCPQDEVIAALRERGLWPTRGKQSNDQHRRALEATVEHGGPNFVELLGHKPTIVYEYRSLTGATLGFVARTDRNGSKEIRPVTPWLDEKDRPAWLVKGFAEPLPLFGQEELQGAPESPVLVVEGEKAALAARNIFSDHLVVTWPQGANSASKAGWQPLAGRRVVLWPDADDAGRDAMRAVAAALVSVGAEEVLRVYLPETFPKGWDLADKPPDGFNLVSALRDAEIFEPSLTRHIYSAEELLRLPVPAVEYIIEHFLPTRSLAMVHAERGLGKTWFCLTLAIQLAKGERFFRYHVPKARRVLYVDGEMALAELQERLRLLEPELPEGLELLPSELLFAEDVPLNINNPADQDRIVQALARLDAKGRRPEIIIFDNLSSLATGTDENSNTELDSLIGFLLKLRHAGFSVLLVHHSGKAGAQRGASRREDLLNLSIKLERPEASSADESSGGAHFVMNFSKIRGRAPNPYRIELRLEEFSGDRVIWHVDDAPQVLKEDEALKAVAIHRPSTQRELAEILRVSSGRVSQHCKKLRDRNLLDEKLKVTAKGFERLRALWPGEADKFDRQDDLPI